MTAAVASGRISLALARLDALAERDNQPRYLIRPAAGGGYWSFSDGHVLFRFPESLAPGVDLARWVEITWPLPRLLEGTDRKAARTTMTGSAWREALGRLLDPEQSRWGEDGLDVTMFETYPGPDDSRTLLAAVNSRLLRVALMPGAPSELIVADVAQHEPVWLHGDCWSAAVAPLRSVPRARSERRILVP